MTFKILFTAAVAAACLNASAAANSETAKLADEGNTRDWLSVGRTYSEQHYSPLADINSKNVSGLGLKWALDIPGAVSLEATPLVVDGVIYFTSSESVAYAVDARTGKQLWRYDPEVWRVAGKRLRNMYHVNRGMAYWKGRVYFGSFDGRLIALDTKTGHKAWEVMTLDEFPTGFITGAPRAFNDKVIIGNGGAESGKARGFVTAYDTTSGKKLWRFYTVPGEPAKGFENKAMEMAAKTWTGEWWKFGGGGTVWNAMTYDPEFNRIYLGVGNGTPWNRKVRSPEGGDNLFLCSVVALDADTGEYVWHYQTTPGESWDYNSSMDMTLAELKIDGEMRKVILHAPKNGFFYVIDRTTGKLISAEKIAKATWAEKVDLTTGKPVENPDARVPNGGALVWPGAVGAHNWQAMSFNPNTGLVYIPKLEMPMYYSDAHIDKATWKLTPNFDRNSGYDVPVFDVDAPPPSDIKISAALLAWNPVTQSKAWEVPMAGLWNGGTLSTAGNLVFQGNATGEFAAYDAVTGEKRWSQSAGLGIVGAPVTYKLGTTQYVSILVGWGGSLPGVGVGVNQHGWNYGKQPRRLLTFALDGKAKLPPTPAPEIVVPLDDPALQIDDNEAQKGRTVFNTSCAACHGWEAIAGGAAPDLRASPIAFRLESFSLLLKTGPLMSRGMAKFDDLTDEQIRQLHQFLRLRARKALGKMAAP
jgi:quinohemoprotein ethanol dehydrogenase